MSSAQIRGHFFPSIGALGKEFQRWYFQWHGDKLRLCAKSSYHQENLPAFSRQSQSTY
jgi:hypothetical protein